MSREDAAKAAEPVWQPELDAQSRLEAGLGPKLKPGVRPR